MRGTAIIFRGSIADIGYTTDDVPEGIQPGNMGSHQAIFSIDFTLREFHMLTRHAQIRSQQRAIPGLVLDLLLQFGASENRLWGIQDVLRQGSAPAGTCLRRLHRAPAGQTS